MLFLTHPRIAAVESSGRDGGRGGHDRHHRLEPEPD
jgi:hypothetical protein